MAVAPRAWRKIDGLCRGDAKTGVAVPDPRASLRVVAHILYLGGPGRATQFTSVSEREDVAENFAGRHGKVWRTTLPSARSNHADPIPRLQLMRDLTGRGKGVCAWDDPWEVSQARVYVEQWSEHLLDWNRVAPEDIKGAIQRAFR